MTIINEPSYLQFAKPEKQLTDQQPQNRFRLIHIARIHVVPFLLLLTLVALAFNEILTHTFLVNWDDQLYITTNPAIRGFTLQNLKAAFTKYYVGNYAPIQIISYMLDFTLWGGEPFGYLLANIFYHFLSGILLYLVLVRYGINKWCACVGAAIFLVHPVQIESVAWLSQRKNLLAMLFYLLAFHSYLTYRKSETLSPRRWYLWSVLLFSLSILAKSVAVIFPLMLVLHDLLVAPRRYRLKDHVDKIPYVVAASAVAVLAVISQGIDYGGGRVEYPANALITLPCTMLPILVTYLRMLFWPAPSSLSIMYFPLVRSGLDVDVIWAIVVAVLLIAIGVTLYRKDRSLLFWYGLFFLGFLPVSQIVPLVTWMNDRYLYFPMVGVAGLSAYLLSEVRDKFGVASYRVMLIMSVPVIVALASASHLRGRAWKDTVSLFSDAVEKYPKQATTWSRLAEGYVINGDFKQARELYEKAASVGSLDYDANYNLVQIYFKFGEFATAYKHIWGMLLSPSQSKRALLLLGEYSIHMGNSADAERYLLMYLQNYPDSVHGLYELGRVYLAKGDTERAGEYFYKTFAAGGTHPQLYLASACVELRKGEPGRSFKALQAAFESGLSAEELYNDNPCRSDFNHEPRLRQLIQLHGGE